MRIPVQHIPDDIMQQYQLKSLAVNGFVMVEIRKGMYGLQQTGIIGSNQLQKHLANRIISHVKRYLVCISMRFSTLRLL